MDTGRNIEEGKTIGSYIVGKCIGEGKFGVVYQASHKDTGASYAIKQIPRHRIDIDPTLKRLMLTEVSIMKEISHPNILHLHDFLQSGNNYYLVMQYCKQGDLESYMLSNEIKHFDEAQAVMLLKQIINGFSELRKYQIIHRDFKLSNILLDDQRLVIGDFGMAKAGFEITMTRLGTPIIMAPELLRHDGESEACYNSKVDIWSIGIVYYQLLFGDAPFFGLSNAELLNNISRKSGANLKFPRAVTDESKDLLRRMLTAQPEARITWAQCFDHPLFAKFPANSVVVSNTTFFEINGLGITSDEVNLKTDTEFNQKKSRIKESGENAMPAPVSRAVQEKAPLGQHVQDTPSKPSNPRPAFDEHLVSNEVYFRYAHEYNKISFFVFTAATIQSLFCTARFGPMDQQLINICLLLVKKASVLNRANLARLASKSNIFGINEADFASFCRSEFYGKVLSLLTLEAPKLQQYLSLLVQRAHTNYLPIIYSKVIGQETASLNDIDNGLNKELANVRVKVPAISNFPDRCMIATAVDRVAYAINSESTFPYFVAGGNGPSAKFSWPLFYKRLADGELKAPSFHKST